MSWHRFKVAPQIGYTRRQRRKQEQHCSRRQNKYEIERDLIGKKVISRKAERSGYTATPTRPLYWRPELPEQD
jgi:hypothetical protein